MNKISFFALMLFLFSSVISFGQNNLKISESENDRLIQVLNNAELLQEKNGESISVKIFRMNNGAGSAGTPSSEVNYNLLIAVSENGVLPYQKLYEIGPINDPVFMRWLGKDGPFQEFEIEHGWYNKRESLKLIVSMDELKIN